MVLYTVGASLASLAESQADAGTFKTHGVASFDGGGRGAKYDIIETEGGNATLAVRLYRHADAARHSMYAPRLHNRIWPLLSRLDGPCRASADCQMRIRSYSMRRPALMLKPATSSLVPHAL